MTTYHAHVGDSGLPRAFVAKVNGAVPVWTETPLLAFEVRKPSGVVAALTSTFAVTSLSACSYTWVPAATTVLDEVGAWEFTLVVRHGEERYRCDSQILTVGPRLTAEAESDALYPLRTAEPAAADFTRASTAYEEQEDGTLIERAANVARFAWCPGLGATAYYAEPAVTNLANTDLGSWTPNAVPTDVAVQEDVAEAPDGTDTAARLSWLTGDPATGLYDFDAGQPAGDYATSIYARGDYQPDDVDIRNPNGGSGYVQQRVPESWGRVKRRDTAVGGVSGMYIRRNTKTGGAVQLWGPMRHAWDGGKYFAYHPSTKAADVMALPVAPLASGADGSVWIEWVPLHDADDEVGVTDTVILDIAGTDLRLVYRGSQTPSYLALHNNAGAEVCSLRTKHRAGDPLRIGIHWGGTPTRPWLSCNGYAIRGSAAWVTPSLRAQLTVGCLADGSLGAAGWFRDLDISADRYEYARRIAAFGDSISTEGNTSPFQSYGSADHSWIYYAGALLESDSLVLSAGVPSDTLALMLARITTDVIDQDPTHCVILAGVNDLVAGRSLVQMQGDFNALTTALAAAGIPVVACTVLPFGGHAAWDGAKEAVRVAYNSWIMTTAANVATRIDTATALADPGDTDTLLPAYDSADHVHPSGAGGEALAAAIVAGAFA